MLSRPLLRFLTRIHSRDDLIEDLDLHPDAIETLPAIFPGFIDGGDTLRDLAVCRCPGKLTGRGWHAD